jgi:hypothetical protein
MVKSLDRLIDIIRNAEKEDKLSEKNFRKNFNSPSKNQNSLPGKNS